jgi:hypothetical protein
MKKGFFGAWGPAIMQRTKLETHVNFDRKAENKNALTETPIVNEDNSVNQKVLKQLEFFAQNRLGKHLSYRTMDNAITERRGRTEYKYLEKQSYPFNRSPTHPSGIMGV